MTRQFTMQRGTTRVVFGAGASERILQEIEALGLERVLVACSAGRKDEAAALAGRLGGRGAGVMPLAREHVPVEIVTQARRDVHHTSADGVLALGGGSAIGLAKALALTTPVRVLCIPTTYSGSEMTPVYGITEGREKKTGRDERVRPALVVYDPKLTLALPRDATLPSLWNAMAHAVEGLWARSSDRATALAAEEALRLLASSAARLAGRPGDEGARADALEWLEARRHEAEAMLAAAHVLGEAGGGKTRLMGEFLARCTSRGDLVVSVGPDAAWAKVADTALREAVGRLAAFSSDAPDPQLWTDARPDAQLGLTLLFGGPRESEFPTAARRRLALAEALRWALEQASERAAGALVVLAVDDLDFVDGTSCNAFADVLSEPPVVGALVIVTYAQTASPAGEPLAGETRTLEPLPSSAFTHLIPARLMNEARPLAPLHVEHLIAWSRESRETPPDRMADLVARRAERVTPDARHALHALAVWGDDASLDVLPRLLPQGVDLDAALRLLDRARLVVHAGRSVRIAHPLVRRVVFSSIPAGRKRELFARAEELRPDAPLEIRAKQAMHGGSALEALSLLDMLSIRRAAQGDLLGAVSSLRHALDVTRRELHGDDLDDPMSAMLVFARKLAEALAASSQWNDAEGVLREALGNAPPASEHRARLLAVLAHVAHARSHPGEARRYIDEAMRVARQSEHRSLIPMLERLERTIAVA